MPTATLNIIINSIFEKVKDFGKLFLRYFISFCSARGVRAKFFRVSALRLPLPSLCQILFFALADFFKISVLDRFFSWGFAPIFLFFPPLSEIFRTILFHAFLLQSPYLSWLYYTPFSTILSTLFAQFILFFVLFYYLFVSVYYIIVCLDYALHLA